MLHEKLVFQGLLKNLHRTEGNQTMGPTRVTQGVTDHKSSTATADGQRLLELQWWQFNFYQSSIMNLFTMNARHIKFNVI